MGRGRIERDIARRDDRWSESIAVGSEVFVEQVKIELGFRALYRQVLVAEGLYTLREPVRLMATISIGKMRLQGEITPIPGKQTLKPTEA